MAGTEGPTPTTWWRSVHGGRLALLAWAIVVLVVTVSWGGAAFAASARGMFGWEGTGTESGPQQADQVAVAPTLTPLALSSEQLSLGEGAPMARSEPVRLTIESIGLDTSLIQLGLLADGSLEVPPDGTSAGWFVGAPTPGELGPAVIAGHVDWDGPAVFYDLHSVVPGDLIDVVRADGSTAVFEVTEVGTYPKDAFPTEAVYGPVAFAGLRVITCGGDFNSSTGHYEDNFVAFAALVSSSSGGAK